LEKYNGKRKHAAKELGISERTLYRKIKEHNIDL
jgi:transcriptional regulator of acetoin/glycerol metabolism